MAENLTRDEQAKKYIPLSSAGIVLVVIGLLVLDGTAQFVFLIAGAAAAMFAAEKIIQLQKAEG